MGYYEPDLTGVDPNYLTQNDSYVIYGTGQSIIFNSPVYLNSIIATLIATINIPLVEGVDWTYTPSDIDSTSTGKMKTVDSAFSAILVKGIEFIRSITAPITVSLSYQSLYPVAYKVAVSENQTVALTPDLVISILNRLSNIELLTSAAESTTALTTGVPRLLAIDITGTASANLITGEIATINTLIGKNIIFPVNGSFYGTGVIITQADGSNTVLNVGTDYQFFGMNVGKTQTTNSTSPVYEFILVTKPYVGEVSLTYQAYGGEVTLADVTTIYSEVQSLAAYIGNNPFVTVPGLPGLPNFQSIVSRMAALEGQMRALINSGIPTYSDVTGNGSFVISKIRSVDTVNHWWTIATLYKVNGSNSVVTADRMHLRIRLATAAQSFDIFPVLDLNVPASIFSLDSIAVNQDVGFAPNGTVRSIPVVMPQFRVIYNTGGTSGVCLQIGLALPSLTETIAIEDLSGSQSCWLLAGALTSPTLPMDNTITLPDGTSIWDTSTPSTSLSVIHMMPNKTGYLAWSGTESIANIAADSPLTTILPNTFNLSDINSVDLIFNTSSTAPIRVIVPMNTSPVTAGAMAGSAYIPSSQPDGTPTLVDVSLQLVDSIITLIVTPELFYSLETNLTLIQAVVHV